MKHSLGARWRALLIVAVLTLSACSERSDPKETVERQPARDGQRAAAVARGKIEVDGGLVALAPALAGTVASLTVREGDRVQRGQLLLAQASQVSSAAVAVATSELKLARARQQAAEGRLPELKQAAARYAQAVRAGAAQPQLADDAQQRLRDAQSDVAVATAEAAVAQQRLEQAKVALQQLELRAPEDGVIVGVTARQGGRLEAGAPALTLLPARPLIVRAELNSAYVASVRVGMRATVASDMDSEAAAPALPSAKLVRISPIYGNGRLQDDAQRGPVRVVECILEFDGPAEAIVGQNVRVTFHE